MPNASEPDSDPDPELEALRLELEAMEQRIGRWHADGSPAAEAEAIADAQDELHARLAAALARRDGSAPRSN